MDLDAIREAIEKATGKRPEDQPQRVGGGCIHDTFRLGDFFVKSNTPEAAAMFAAERAGLAALHGSGTVRVPEPVCAGETASHAFLVLEYLPLGGNRGKSQAELGRRLAALHRTTHNQFGFDEDNFIGATPQPNPGTASWIEFLREHRLLHMLHLAADCGFAFQRAQVLMDGLASFFDQEPAPSLLHGDLWGGNADALVDGTPVVFDPAVYYGDREADLAMTTLFGGFSGEFYAAYEESWPLPDRHAVRRDLYNLYHILNHAVLFGGGYARQAQTLIDHLVKQL